MQPTIEQRRTNAKATTGAGTVESKPRLRAPSSLYRDPEGRFEIVASDGTDVDRFFKWTHIPPLMRLLSGEFTVWGDLCEAIRFFGRQRHSAAGSFIFTVAARVGRLWDGFRRRSQTGADIQFHYDRSNEFYEQFLDSRMQYSAGDFCDPRTVARGGATPKAGWYLQEAETTTGRATAGRRLRMGRPADPCGGALWGERRRMYSESAAIRVCL